MPKLTKFLRGAVLEGQTLDLRSVKVVLGPRLEACACTLHLKEFRATYSTFKECHFLFSGKGNSEWNMCEFHSCRFEGNFRGHGFAVGKNAGEPGVMGCDFSKAKLDNCQFFGDGFETNKFAPWPTVALPIPDVVGASLLVEDGWPQGFSSMLRIGRKSQGLVFDAERLVKDFGGSLEDMERSARRLKLCP